MKYMGSKRRIAKEIATYINNSAKALGISNYYEPFCGGASVIQKVDIKNRYGSDLNNYVIALLQFIRDGGFDNYNPGIISEEEFYKVKAARGTGQYPDWYTCYVGLYCSYRGRWFDAYFRTHLDSKSGAVRSNLDSYDNMVSEKKTLQGIEFTVSRYNDVEMKENSIIYCDAPYLSTKGYTKEKFDFDKYYEWLKEKAKNNLVFISEYFMPADGFEQITEYQLSGGVGSGNTEDDYNPIERLYIVRGGWGTGLLNNDEVELDDIL